MSTTKTFKVNQNISRQLKCRAVGYYDYTNIVTPTKENSNLNIEMQEYDGLNYTLNNNGDSVDLIDFSGTILPWKFDMNNYLAKTKYCLQQYQETPYDIEMFERKYKYIENVGGLTDNNGVFSGFSTSKYLKLKEKFNPNAPWSINIKFRRLTTSYPTMIFGHSEPGLIQISIWETGLYLSLSTITSDWDIGSVSWEGSFETDKDYWVKAEFTGTEYKMYGSENGKDYELKSTLNSSTSFVMPDELLLGFCNGSCLNGTIDLNETFITGYTIVAETDDPEAVLVEQAFSQPILTENGTIGGSSFAVSADNETSGRNPAYYAFDGNDSTYWRGANVPGYIEFYNPSPIIVTALTWGFFYSYPTSGNVQGSNDYLDWTTITEFTNDSEGDFTIDMSGNTNSYKYYRINVSSVNMDVLHCKNLTIVGTVKGYGVDVTYGLADCIYVKEPVINYNIVGSPTIENNIASGFGNGNYITLDNSFVSKNATYVFKVTFPSSMSSSQCIFEQDYFANIEFRGNTKDLRAWNWQNSQYEKIMDITVGKTYWFKMVINDSVKTYSYSENGQDYIEAYVMNDNATNTTSSNFFIGVTSRRGNVFQGSIDLTESYVELDGEIKYLVDSAIEQLYGIIDDANFTTSLPVYCYANRDERVVLRNTKTENFDTSDWYLGEVKLFELDHELDV